MQLIELFYQRYSRLETFKKFNNIPKYILETEKKLVKEAADKLMLEGTNIYEYLKTTKGAIEYELYVASKNLRYRAEDRCGGCEHYVYIPGEVRTFFCSLKQQDFILCDKFLDSNENFSLRLQKAIDQCSACSICIKSFVEVLELEEHKCPANQNAFKCTMKI